MNCKSATDTCTIRVQVWGKSTMEEDEETPMPSVAQVSSSDDSEANEDLSLKIVQKSLLRRAAKSIPDQFVFEDVDAGDDICGSRMMLDLDSAAPLVVQAVAGPSGTSCDPVVVSEGEDGKGRKKNRKEREKSKVDTIEKIEVVDIESESADPNAVEIPGNIMLLKLLRGPRYFDPHDNSWGICYNCGEEGHNAVNCTSARRKKPCFVCGSFEHNVRNCTKGRDCFICKNFGHCAKDCPDKYKKSTVSSQICLKCGDSGHEMFSCRNDYSPDDLKEILCYVCKRFGHLCCISSDDTDSREISCYTCGQLGHSALACNWVHGEITSAASPNLCYRCGEGGHFARECTSSAKKGKRNREFSTPAGRLSKEDKDYLRFHSVPNYLVKALKKKKDRHEERGVTTPKNLRHRGGWSTDVIEESRKSKHRGGWSTQDPRDSRKSRHQGGRSTEDLGDFSYKKSKRSNCMPPATPIGKGHKISALTAGGQISTSRSPKKTWKRHPRHSPAQGSGNAYYHHRYSASRFGNSARNRR